MKKVFVFLILMLMVLIPMTAAAEVSPLPIDTGDVTWLGEYLDFVIVGVCLVIGLLWKHCTGLDNKYIPLIVVAIGLIIAVWTHWSEGITAKVVLSGMFSGLASTGFHQIFKQLFPARDETF